MKLKLLKPINLFFLLLFCVTVSGISTLRAQNKFKVIGYYHPNKNRQIEKYHIEKLTHIIFSFAHLKNGKLILNNSADSLALQNLVSLKEKKAKDLKVMIAFGGWGGCESCSDIFASKELTKKFVDSAVQFITFFKLDGIDIDWEYPGIEGYPGHKFQKGDKQSFTFLVQELRRKLGKQKLISFAAGGFETFFQNSIDWKKITPLVDWVNIMTYDYAVSAKDHTAHNSPLYSSEKEPASTNNIVEFAINKAKIAPEKLCIGVPFYGKIWDNVHNIAHPVFAKGNFVSTLSYFELRRIFAQKSFYHLDKQAQVEYAYDSQKGFFATLETPNSIKTKCDFIRKKHLGGIMFWELSQDKYDKGLLDAINLNH